MAPKRLGHWQTRSSRVAYRNSWISVREDQVLRPDGRPGIYGVVDLTGSSIIVALNEAREVWLVKQWRYPLSSYTLELPWGGRKVRETYLRAAQRELREEAGLTARSWHALGKVADCPGIVNEFVYIFLARKLTQVGAVTISEESDQSVVTVPFAQALSWIHQEKINDAVSIAALVRAQKFLHL